MLFYQWSDNRCELWLCWVCFYVIHCTNKFLQYRSLCRPGEIRTFSTSNVVCISSRQYHLDIMIKCWNGKLLRPICSTLPHAMLLTGCTVICSKICSSPLTTSTIRIVLNGWRSSMYSRVINSLLKSLSSYITTKGYSRFRLLYSCYMVHEVHQWCLAY